MAFVDMPQLHVQTCGAGAEFRDTYESRFTQSIPKIAKDHFPVMCIGREHSLG